MTERLYLHSDDLSAKVTVLNCQPASEGTFYVELASTIFHPQGGGQPSDTGTIGPANVISVNQNDDAVIHLTDTSLSPGEWIAKVNPVIRKLHTRMHSAGHLIAAVVEGISWKAVKANHRPGEGRVVFEPDVESPVLPEIDEISIGVNNLVHHNLPRQQDISNGVRTVTWGELAPYMCGGTHVLSTGEVGNIEITSVKFRKGMLSVSYTVS